MEVKVIEKMKKTWDEAWNEFWVSLFLYNESDLTIYICILIQELLML